MRLGNIQFKDDAALDAIVFTWIKKQTSSFS